MSMVENPKEWCSGKIIRVKISGLKPVKLISEDN